MRPTQIGPVLAMLTMLCIAGCKKDDPVPGPATADGANTGGTIQMGLGTNMFVQHFSDTIQIPLNAQVTKYLDLDNDGTADVNLTGYTAVSPGSSFREYSWLQALRPEVRISTRIVTDTSFLHVDTVGTNIYEYFSCSRMNADDQVLSSTPGQEKIKGFQEDEVLTDNEGFSTDSVNLRRSNTMSPIPIEQGGYFVSWESNADCDLFPEDVVRYIGTAITRADGTLRLGWVKLEYRSNFHQYVLFSTAIQQ